MCWNFHTQICWREYTPLGEPVPPSRGFFPPESNPVKERQERWEKMKAEWNPEDDKHFEAMTDSRIDRQREKREKL